jgi:N6-L-threonylcarbamoyladenine synthase
MKNRIFLLACESSCDETAFAIYDIKNEKIIESIVYSQILLHKNFGGVIPEVASKEHLEKIETVLNEVLIKSNLKLEDIDYFAATTGPGLPGALLIGMNFTKSIAWSLKKPFIAVNHLSGHIYSSFLENNPSFPHICLSASGGHTSLYLVKNETEYETIGDTQDDAAGECFDKIAKLLSLGYPGGSIIEKIAESENFIDKRKYPRLKNKDLNFSFSGLKTAVLYDVIKAGYFDEIDKKIKKDTPTYFINSVSSSLLCAISDILCNKIEIAMKIYPEIQGISFVGGVACNKYIKTKIFQLTKKNNIDFWTPSSKYCSDNAAMIAITASFLIKNNINKDLSYYDEIKI